MTARDVPASDVTVLDVTAPVRFCPHCGRLLDHQAFVQEYWTGQTRVFHLWCRACRFTADVVPTERMLGHEPAHR